MRAHRIHILHGLFAVAAGHWIPGHGIQKPAVEVHGGGFTLDDIVDDPAIAMLPPQLAAIADVGRSKSQPSTAFAKASKASYVKELSTKKPRPIPKVTSAVKITTKVSIQNIAKAKPSTSTSGKVSSSTTKISSTSKTSIVTTSSSIHGAAFTSSFIITASSSTSSSVSATQSLVLPVATGPTPAVFATAPYPSNLGSFYNYDFVGDAQFSSAHFTMWNTTADVATAGLRSLEGVYDCFVSGLGWRNPGVPFYDDPSVGPFYKVDMFVTPYLPIVNASGVTTGDITTGLGYSWLQPVFADSSAIVAHEFGHVMTFAQQQFWNSSNAMGWAEMIAQFVDESYNHSPMCAKSRAKTGDSTSFTLFDPEVTISQSYMTMVDATPMTGNQYQAWPWLVYLTSNPDNYNGLGAQVMLDMFETYATNSDETPFHTLDRMTTTQSIQSVVAQYWARMAWVDFGDYQMQWLWNLTRAQLDYDNTYQVAPNTYRVVATKSPLYMGASIIPLSSSAQTISVHVDGSSDFLATLAIRNSLDNTVRYLPLSDMTASSSAASQAISVTLSPSQTAVLVIANTPATLLMYDNRNLSGAAAAGLDFNVTLAGASPLKSMVNTPLCYYTGDC